MDKEIFIPFISGLVGALIGAVGSIVTVWLQSNKTDKRQKISSIIDMSWREYEKNYEVAKATRQRFSIAPITVYYYYNQKILEILEKGKLSVEDLKKVDAEFELIKKYYEDKRT